MACNQSQNWMPDYLDGELEVSVAAGYAAHLASCETCSEACAHLADLRATINGNATRYKASAALRARVLNDLVDPKVGDIDRKRKKFDIFTGFRAAGMWSWARINFGIASLCTLAFAVTLALYVQAPSTTDLLDQEIVAAHFRSLQVDHLADVASTDQHTVKPWFSGKLDYSPPVVDAAQDGFALLGGRLDYFNRRSVAGLAYRHGKHLVNLFVWPDGSTGEASGKLTSIRGFNLLRWTHAGMAYAAVSDMNSGELLVFQKRLMEKIVDEERIPYGQAGGLDLLAGRRREG